MEHMEHMEHEELCQPKSWSSYLENGSRTYTWTLLFHLFHVFQRAGVEVGDVGHEEPRLGTGKVDRRPQRSTGTPSMRRTSPAVSPKLVHGAFTELQRADLATGYRP